MDVAQALTLAEDLKNALEQEIENARDEQHLLADLQIDGLLRRAALREAFNARASFVQRELTDALRTRGSASGASQSRALDEALSAIRRLAAELKRQDQLNLTLATRTLSFVQAYMTAICPRPSAYDRYGRQTALAPERGSVSQRI